MKSNPQSPTAAATATENPTATHNQEREDIPVTPGSFTIPPPGTIDPDMNDNQATTTAAATAADKPQKNNKRESQYVDAYLDGGGRLTISTFLTYTLHGKASDYVRSYQIALLNSMKRRLATGEVEECRSAHGRVAYRRRTQA